MKRPKRRRDETQNKKKRRKKNENNILLKANSSRGRFHFLRPTQPTTKIILSFELFGFFSSNGAPQHHIHIALSHSPSFGFGFFSLHHSLAHSGADRIAQATASRARTPMKLNTHERALRVNRYDSIGMHHHYFYVCELKAPFSHQRRRRRRLVSRFFFLRLL